MEKADFNLENALKTFAAGENYHAEQLFGPHRVEEGYLFRVWAPNAQMIWLVGDFNDWEDTLPMEKDGYGVWSALTNDAKEGQLYKFKVKQSTGRIVYKIDPYAMRFEERPNDASIIHTIPEFKWSDGLWRGRQKRSNYFERPLNIYEVHAGSWKNHDDGRPYDFDDLTEELVPYLKKMNYTHVEFMPLMEHPLDASWGYQLIGYFAFCQAYGKPEQFQRFVDECHNQNIGVIVDWVPGHYCINDDALAYFDGTATYEYEDHDRASNPEWGALNFDLGKPQVQSFLISSAFFWIEKFHLDGLRIDAVSNMIYLDYGDKPWKPNKYGGNRNLEGWHFLRKFNKVVKFAHPKTILIAEESSAGTKVTGMLEEDSLGFDYKWNMGWMNDVLNFFQMDPLFRGDHLDMLTFSWMYRMSENFVLPLSHDEVVHGKKSLMNKMWGDRYRQLAQLRTLYAYQMTHPGKKLLFMGSEWGQYLEWRYYEGLPFGDLEDELNAKMQHFTATLNKLYREERSLWETENKPESLEVIDADNREQTILSFVRHGKKKNDFLIIIMNLTAVEQNDFSIGVPYPGTYKEILNTETKEFGGTLLRRNPQKKTNDATFKNYDQSIKTNVPAFGTLILKPVDVNTRYVNHLYRMTDEEKKEDKKKKKSPRKKKTKITVKTESPKTKKVTSKK